MYFLKYYIKIHRMPEYKFQGNIFAGVYISPATLLGEIKLNTVF